MRQDTNSLLGSPILIGAASVLVGVVAVFLAYNANTGLPFVPTYTVHAYLPDAEELVPGNEVRVGGKRVGIVKTITAEQGPADEPVARLELQLDKVIEPLHSDSELTVRARSPLGLKYLQLVPGRRGRALAGGAVIPLSQARRTVELDELFDTFDARTRRALSGTLHHAGDGFAGRGVDVNAAAEHAPELVRLAELVARNLSSPRTDLRGLLSGLDAFSGELASAARPLEALVADLATTTAAFASARNELGEAIAAAPATEDAAIAAFEAADPLLTELERLVRDARPGTAILGRAASRIDAALDRTLPTVRRTPPLLARLRDTLRALEAVARDPLATLALTRLRTTLTALEPSVRYLAPLQLRCNYLALYARNIASVVSEGDPSGTWFRTLSINHPEETSPQAQPAPQLHVNPYPHTGQQGECEAGNERFGAGRAIGNTPAREPGRTEETRAPAEVAGR